MASKNSSPDAEDISSAESKTNINDRTADQIQQEWFFWASRVPENLVTQVGLVKGALLISEALLIISNNVQRLGLWESFTALSTQYRDAFSSSDFGRAAQLDSPSLDQYSLWRGWVVPSFLAGSAYIIASLLLLRHELYHWKPELLNHYLKAVKDSWVGRYVPHPFLDRCFQLYEVKHRKHVANQIQRRKHMALEDSKAFLKILRTVSFNILISVLVILALWLLFLRTKLESHKISQLPKSYVPPIQMLVWYIINDFFYFYPHWIAHMSASSPRATYFKVMPRNVATALHQYFKETHRQHHRTKANIGLAAWYCSPWEQLLFNLFPAVVGPLFTQILADAWGWEQIWGTHLITLYVWLIAAAMSSVLAHSGYRSRWNDPGKHDLHHERAFGPDAVNFGTFGIFDWLHGTLSSVSKVDTKAWRAQRDRQAALIEASKRTGVPLTKQQLEVIEQPNHSQEWVDKNI